MKSANYIWYCENVLEKLLSTHFSQSRLVLISIIPGKVFIQFRWNFSIFSLCFQSDWHTFQDLMLSKYVTKHDTSQQSVVWVTTIDLLWMKKASQRIPSFITLIAFASQRQQNFKMNGLTRSFWQRQKTSSACKVWELSSIVVAVLLSRFFLCVRRQLLFITINLFSFYFHTICCEREALHEMCKLCHTFVLFRLFHHIFLHHYVFPFCVKRGRGGKNDLWHKRVAKVLQSFHYKRFSTSPRVKESQEFFNSHSIEKIHTDLSKTLKSHYSCVQILRNETLVASACTRPSHPMAAARTIFIHSKYICAESEACETTKICNIKYLSGEVKLQAHSQICAHTLWDVEFGVFIFSTSWAPPSHMYVNEFNTEKLHTKIPGKCTWKVSSPHHTRSCMHAALCLFK